MSRPPLSTSAVVLRAAQLADADGLGAVTLAAVARSLGVRTPSLYSHVRDLAALRDGVTVLALDELADRVADAVVGRSGGEALAGFAAAHRSYAHEHPGRWEALHRRAGPAAVQAPAAGRVVRLTEAVLLGYPVPPADRVHATRFLGATLSGFLDLERLGSFDHSSPAPVQSWRELLRSLHLVLSHWSTRDPIPPQESS
ncbi:TetR/AcrR family transcriptional regulator [Kineococcus sp. TBRC 1896]|uniref:TetR/AcrR family transcriptional regulator n=1 Tax=Kineococcus mangrovi TaxID=1660183 RepID=A0ABV4I5I5_9ACTN